MGDMVAEEPFCCAPRPTEISFLKQSIIATDIYDWYMIEQRDSTVIKRNFDYL